MVDVGACCRRGAIGAVGAIPGTALAHPFDVCKMRMQVTGEGRLAPTLAAIRCAGGGSLASGCYRGVFAGITQKVATRGPMFLASELCTQLCMEHAGMSRDRALFAGSFLSGYITGFVAAPAEWAKVQRGARTTSSASGGGGSGGGGGGGGLPFAHHLRQPAALRRFHGAGLRNGVFDSTFFGCEHALREIGLPPELSFAAAAALAMTVDFPIDVAVKRSMAVPPGRDVRWPVAATVRLLRANGLATFAGINLKACEYAVSYFVTGACSRPLAALAPSA